MHQSALLGQGLLWRSLGRSLRGNFKACAARQAGGWVGAAASRRVQNNLFIRTVVRLPQSTL